MKYLKYFEKLKSYDNKRLKSLVKLNLPKYWDGDFNCDTNKLTNLIGSPQNVTVAFWCNDNNLTSLEGGPIKVGDGFYCQKNKLTNLIGSPQSFFGEFNCSYNQLTSLDGAPQNISGDFKCDYNNLTTLEDLPNIIGGVVYCSNNSWETPIKHNIIDKYTINIATLYTLSQQEKFSSYEFQKDFLTETPEKYKDLIHIGFHYKIKDEFDWLFNAIDMGLM